MFTALDNTFTVCIIVGFVIPLLNILTGWFGNAFDLNTDVEVDLDVDLDLDLDVGVDGGGTPFPFHFMCFCLLLIVFGAIGKVLYQWMDTVFLSITLTLAALAAGVVFYLLMYKLLVQRLKASNPVTLSYGELVGKSGKVTLRVSQTRIGMISIPDSTGAALSFRAKVDPDLKDLIGESIEPGETVVITEVDIKEKLCYVSTKLHGYKMNI